MKKPVAASEKAMRLVDLIFRTKGLKKITPFRDLVRNSALFAFGQSKENRVYTKVEGNDGIETDRMCSDNRSFIAGWEAAGGGDLYVTWHWGSSYPEVIFWREDPAELLEKLLKEHRPDLLVKSVQDA